MIKALHQLKEHLKGDLLFDELHTRIYATDASVYSIKPLAVAYPKTTEDFQKLVTFATTHNTSLIPRAAGTSLAGQCVGAGIIVDTSKYFTKILNFNEIEKTVTIQPGVVRDELNIFLKPHGLFFSPNTSTSNRCMLGGMVGNNSSGTTSIKYGVTRDKVVSLQTVLSDGSLITFNDLNAQEINEKGKLNTLEGYIYKTVLENLQDKFTQNEIDTQFPKREIHRRNTGYAIDELLNTAYFNRGEEVFNLCKLLVGSEGTLAFTTEITLKLDQLPPEETALVALHFKSISDCMETVKHTMTHDLYSCEMMDKTILDCTKRNKSQLENRQFISGDPLAILMCEFKSNTKDKLKKQLDAFLNDASVIKQSYHNAVLYDDDVNKAYELRKAGLGLLGNIIGDQKAVACIEDTAVTLDDLSQYIFEFSVLMEQFDQKPVYYAHAGAGEIHLRPILNLKKSEDVAQFEAITTAVAKLVKNYGGSFSGEHGDGIVRASYIPYMLGEHNYKVLQAIKKAFDPNSIFNPGKIVDALPITDNLRYVPDRKEPEIKTFMDFSASEGILKEAEKCNGSGDCRKSEAFGGVMCPSYRATKNEKDTTRARANALRSFLTQSEKKNPFNHKELKEVFSLCLSCKACATECPSSVDVAALKAEFLYQYKKENGASIRTKLLAKNYAINKKTEAVSGISNVLFSNSFTGYFIKKALGISTKRSLPSISNKTLSKSIQIPKKQTVVVKKIKTVYLFNDEFTNYYDSQIGLDALELFTRLNYDVIVLKNEESGRALISKGFLEEAKKVADYNIALYKDVVSKSSPLIGIEPSAILTFRDEYLKLASHKTVAKELATHTYMIEEFLAQEIACGNIKPAQFTEAHKTIKFHGHCYQKAISSQIHSFHILNLPTNYKVTLIPSGCCGMAGSFGYEKENYKVSMQIGEQTLFPAVRKASSEVIISANGTSCRHQIKDGTQRAAFHPVSILKDALL
jgi:FAD/FMN-containing dehydrogenase/Fe-S oxidoreductase